MTFIMHFEIGKDYLLKGTKRRGGTKISKVKFIVLHDVGNDGLNKTTGKKNGTTARNNITYYRNTPTVPASAHTFIDDKEILECIPAVTAAAEKAWHVLYNKTVDNKLYGADANDAAIGVELCYYPEDRVRSVKAYEKFVWYCAYLAYYFKLNPKTCFVGHEKLDPGRKVDPSNGLKYIGKTTEQCIQDIISKYNECTRTAAKEPVKVQALSNGQIGKVTVLVDILNVRNAASFTAPIVKKVKKSEAYKVYEQKNGMYRIGKDMWCSAGKAYVKYTSI